MAFKSPLAQRIWLALNSNVYLPLLAALDRIFGVGWGEVDLAQTSNLVGTYSGSAQTLTVTATGALTVDSVAVAVGNRILLQNQSTGAQRGIYDVTVAGASGVHPVLTRSNDCNASGAFTQGKTVSINRGTVNGGKTYVCTFTPAFVLDTSTPTFAHAPATGGAVTGTVTSGATTGTVTSGAGTGTVTSGATTGTVTSGVVNFTGTTPLSPLNPTAFISGTGGAGAGQVFTTTDNQTVGADALKGMFFCTATQGPFYIASNAAAAGAPLAITFYGAAPITDGGTYKVFNGLAPVGTAALASTATTGTLTSTAVTTTLTSTATTGTLTSTAVTGTIS